MAEIDYDLVLETLVSLAKRAGDIMLGATDGQHQIDATKDSNPINLVTETDKAIESMIYSELSSRFPTFKFLGEESYVPGQRLTDDPTFICDPIDGTTNFVHRYPAFCISLGLSISRKPVVGVVYNPSTRELYTGITGRGSFLTNLYSNVKRQLPLVSQPLNGLGTSVLAVEWGHDRKGVNWDTKIRTFEKLAGAQGALTQSLHSIGSAALNICSVATGTVDGYWEGGPWAWDVCAGWVILKEAGGVMCDANPGVWGEEPPLDGRTYFAVRGAPSGQKELVEEMWRTIEGRFEYSV